MGERNDGQRFDLAVRQIVGKRLTWNQLTGKDDTSRPDKDAVSDVELLSLRMLVDIAARENGVYNYEFPFDPEENSQATNSDFALRASVNEMVR